MSGTPWASRLVRRGPEPQRKIQLAVQTDHMAKLHRRGRGEPKPRSNAGTRPSKSRILLENYFLPGDLETQIEAFVEHYNNQRYHESLNNVTPADAYFGRAPAIIKQRERIKRQTIEYRRLQHRKIAD